VNSSGAGLRVAGRVSMQADRSTNRGGTSMLIDRYEPEDVFARVPELAEQTDPVLVQLDRLLDDDQLYAQVRGDLARRYRLTPVHGRHSTPAEVLLRLLVVQHRYAWSYQETVQRVADSLVLRWFCRLYFRRAPTKATLIRWAATIRPDTLHILVDRAAQLAKQAKVTQARKLRIDSTCVQTTIHHPTDSGVLGDGVRVLSRLIRQAKPLVQASLRRVREVFRSRVRTGRRLLQQIHRVRRFKEGVEAEVQQHALYQRLVAVSRQTVRQANQVRQALEALQTSGRPHEQEPHPHHFASTTASSAVKRLVTRLCAQFDRFLPLVEQAIHQAQRRVLDGQPVTSLEKVLSLFESHTRVVRRGKTGAAVEFGRQVMLDEVEGGIVTRFHVLGDEESECHQALPAIGHHRAVVGRAPQLVTGDRRLHAKGLEAAAQRLGVRHVVIPWTGSLGPARRAVEQDRGWRRRYRWRAGIEGRIHSLRRDYGLGRSRSHGLVGLERDVGWGVLASDLCHIASTQAQRQPSARKAAA
jgi:IS5 family transposase